MRPGTMVSTSVVQNVQSWVSQASKASSQPQSATCWRTMRSSSAPLLSMSSQESTITPGLPAAQRACSTCASFAGKLAGGSSVGWQEGS